MRTRLIVVGLAAAAILTVLAIVLVPRLLIEAFDAGLSTRRFHFEDDRVLIDAPGIKFEGQVENPQSRVLIPTQR